MNSAEQLLASVLDNIPAGLVIHDREWRYTFLNAPAEFMLGRRRADLGKFGADSTKVFPKSRNSWQLRR